jgi:hypothetical protein
MSRATSRLAGDLSAAVANQNDTETVRDGAPAYLLMIDGLIEGDPESTELLLAGAKLYGAYASAFVDDRFRARRLAEKSQAYGLRALCVRLPNVCQAVSRPFDDFVSALANVRRADLPTVYGFAAAWAGWVQANSDDWDAIAQLPKIEAAMLRVLELDETYDAGGAHLYMGVLATQLPPNLGGKPEWAREHFERTIELSGGRNLMAKVLFAKQYARLMFRRDLHDRLLREVLEADPEAPGLTLSNVLAQRKAEGLLAGSDDYF